MRHTIPGDTLGPRGPALTAPIEACVHCGFCLPSCPTYVSLGEEMDSPRGRILLMKEVLEGTLELDGALPYLDNCLGCQACETACPSGVHYGELITGFRAHVEPVRRRPALARLQRALLLETLPFPRRFALAARLARPARRVARALPAQLGAMLELVPARLPTPAPLPARMPAHGPRRGRVALLAGCAQQVLDPDINWATLRVLAANGIETVIPPGQVCCGALALHTGARERALPLARSNLAAFPTDVDAIITTAAGCGSGMADYGLLLAGEAEAEAGAALAERVCDVATFLDRIGLLPPPPLAEPLKVAYHDACHLAHAQGVRAAPRRLLSGIEGIELVEPAEWELCCGSAGTYNVEHPELAASLGARKAANLTATGAELIVTANIGCLSQIALHLREAGREVPLLHTMQVLDRAYAHALKGASPR
jgi:glycolate oxidase iron-sulfur subunit